MLGEFDADAELDVVEEGVEARLIAFARLGQDAEHGIEPGGIDPTNEQIVTQRLELVEQPLPAPHGPPPTLERIAHRLQGEQSFDAGNAGRHGCGSSAARAGWPRNDEVAPRRAARSAATRHSRNARIAVDPHQTHLGYL
jgi:hypothetical protein